MIIQKQFLSKLKDFGLNTYESKLWTALLSRGISTAGELSDIANVPRSRSYDVLESLEKKGFIVMKIGKPIKYIAVPPAEVLERVKKGVQEDADSQAKMLDELKGGKILKELELLHTQGVELIEPSDLSGSIKGRNNLYNHLILALKKAEKSVTILTSTQGLTRKAEAMRSTLKKLKEKGIKVRIAAPITKEASAAVEMLKDFAEIRHTNEISARFLIVDDNEITFMLLDDEKVHPTYDVGVWVNTPYFTSAVQNMFEKQWQDMPKASEVLKS
ncbi:TrmB family transcriptional regulator [Nanoarchaeota archaeon]